MSRQVFTHWLQNTNLDSVGYGSDKEAGKSVSMQINKELQEWIRANPFAKILAFSQVLSTAGDLFTTIIYDE